MLGVNRLVGLGLNVRIEMPLPVVLRSDPTAVEDTASSCDPACMAWHRISGWGISPCQSCHGACVRAELGTRPGGIA